MSLSSAYIELFIRGEKSGGKCPGGNVRIPWARPFANAVRLNGLQAWAYLIVGVFDCGDIGFRSC